MAVYGSLLATRTAAWGTSLNLFFLFSRLFDEQKYHYLFKKAVFFLFFFYSIIVRGEEELGFGWLHLMRWDLTVRSQRNQIYFNVSLTDLLSIHLLKTFREDLNSQVIFITLFGGLAMKEN